MISQKETQYKQILEYLQKYGSITPMQALDYFGCFRLSARIYNMRKDGYIIETEHLRRNGKSFARYIYKGHKDDMKGEIA